MNIHTQETEPPKEKGVAHICPQQGSTGDKPRYFAIIIKDTRPAPDSSRLASVIASTEMGDLLKESCVLPSGCTITRSIEITQELATKAW